MRNDGYTELPHQRIAYDKARGALDAFRPNAADDLRAVLGRDMKLINEAAEGRTVAAIGAMALEAGMRQSPEHRAERFLEDWHKLAKQRLSLRDDGSGTAFRAVGSQMRALTLSIERDAQVESLVRKRLPELGMPARQGISLSQCVQDWLANSRSRGLGR